MSTPTTGVGWTTDLVKRLLNEGGVLSSFNDGFLKVHRRRPVQTLSTDPLNRFFQEGAPELSSPTLVPFAIGQQAVAELGAVCPDDTHQLHGLSFKVVARFQGEHYVNQANSYMSSHPGSSLLAIVNGQAILALTDDKGTPVQKP